MQKVSVIGVSSFFNHALLRNPPRKPLNLAKLRCR